MKLTDFSIPTGNPIPLKPMILESNNVSKTPLFVWADREYDEKDL